jgi:hypothetical protein
MNKALKKAWRDFQHTIAGISCQSTPTEIFHHIKVWYKKNDKFLSPDLIETYRLEELVDIDTDIYPLNKSECTSRSIKNFFRIEPSSEDSMIMILRDQLWELVVLAVDNQCSRCGKLDMSALFDLETEEIVLECTQCGLLQTLNGQIIESKRSVRLAKNIELKNAGLI